MGVLALCSSVDDFIVIEDGDGLEDDLSILLPSAPDFRKQEGLTYPALLLSGVMFVDCLKVLQSIKRKSFREVETWVLAEDGTYHQIGTLQLDSEVLLYLYRLKITATLYTGADEPEEVLDLGNPEVVEMFV